MKNTFKWPKEIYVYWLVEFIHGIELIGAVLLIFFKDWGGLNQAHTQMLQSWFTLWIFILEIPTGVYGDVYGKKKSVITGLIFHTLGIVVYTIAPNIWLFLLGEFIFALGVAFISGAQEAWIYDTTKKLGIEKRYRDVSITGSNLHMIGMIVASLIYIPLSRYFSVDNLFRLGIVPNVLSIILFTLFIKGTDSQNGLKPDYIGIVKKGMAAITKNANLKRLTVFVSVVATASYFVIWLYQESLRVSNTPEPEWGVYRTVLLISQIILVRILGKVFKKSKRFAYFVITLLVSAGFLIGGISQSNIGLIVLLVLSGGIGLQVNTILSKEINEEIDSEQRATVLSFIGMLKRLMLTVFNPVIGYLVDLKGVYVAFIILGLFTLLALWFKPKIKLK